MDRVPVSPETQLAQCKAEAAVLLDAIDAVLRIHGSRTVATPTSTTTP
jgi:hypothetical protein